MEITTQGDRILTTHVGSLPRPTSLSTLLISQLTGAQSDSEKSAELIRDSVIKIVETQADVGIDIVSDGEMGKPSYTFYVKNRLAGIQDRGDRMSEIAGSPINRDESEHPDALSRRQQPGNIFNTGAALPACLGPVSYENTSDLNQDLENFRAALSAASVRNGFLNSASPGVLTKFVPDLYYKNEDTYMEALGEAMRVEYNAIYEAGFQLQIDCPDLASARHNQYQELSDKEFVRIAERNIEILNHATADIPPEAMRMHICWGNYEGPHTHDVPLATIFSTCMRARPAGFLFEGANPRHAHEWEDIIDSHIPDEKILIPGVIDSTTNFVEHPTLVAQRICQYANIVGRERVIASTDCGFATFVQRENRVVTSVVWEKLRSLVQGAAMATDRLWQQ